MTEDVAAGDEALKARILTEPGLILDDPEMMRALLGTDGRPAGRNVVDLRGALVDRLEERLDRLEDTHREVLAAAYENVAGTNQIHRACIAILEPDDFAGFLRVLTHEIAAALSVNIVRLGLEAPAAETGSGLGPAGAMQDVMLALPDGGVDAYITQGRGLGARKVTLRQLAQPSPELYGSHAEAISSEALMRIDLGPGTRPGLLAFGSVEPDRFQPSQGTDLLSFFASVFERVLRRWLA